MSRTVWQKHIIFQLKSAADLLAALLLFANSEYYLAGLLEGAHTGTGLGHEFLRHTQRCRVLVHVVDGSSPDPIGDYKAIQTELELFNPELIDKPQVRMIPMTSPIWCQ